MMITSQTDYLESGITIVGQSCSESLGHIRRAIAHRVRAIEACKPPCFAREKELRLRHRRCMLCMKAQLLSGQSVVTVRGKSAVYQGLHSELDEIHSSFLARLEEAETTGTMRRFSDRRYFSFQAFRTAAVEIKAALHANEACQYSDLLQKLLDDAVGHSSVYVECGERLPDKVPEDSDRIWQKGFDLLLRGHCCDQGAAWEAVLENLSTLDIKVE